MNEIQTAFLNSNNWDEYHRKMGEFSGIPKCCIEWFIKIIKKNIKVAIYTDVKYGKIINGPRLKCGSTYVLCPECRKNYETISIKNKDYRGQKYWDTFENMKRNELSKLVRI